MGMLDNFIWRAYANEMMEHDEEVNKLIEEIKSHYWDSDYEEKAQRLFDNFEGELLNSDIEKIEKETGLINYLSH